MRWGLGVSRSELDVVEGGDRGDEASIALESAEAVLGEVLASAARELEFWPASSEERPDSESCLPEAEGETDEPSRLALLFQAGDLSVLTALYQSVRVYMVPVFARYREQQETGSGRLPATLGMEDLTQESWLIVAELAQRWRSELGSFAAYVRVTFPWSVARYIRRNSPSRRSRNVVVLGAELPTIQEELEAWSGADGREWDIDLAWRERLEHLPEL
jgi:hypothetical protein